MNGSLTQGFELQLTFNGTGSGVDLQIVGGGIQMFAVYTQNNGTLSNQFLSPAAPAEPAYGSGPIAFSFRAPNPVTYTDGVPVELTRFSIE